MRRSLSGSESTLVIACRSAWFARYLLEPLDFFGGDHVPGADQRAETSVLAELADSDLRETECFGGTVSVQEFFFG